MSCKKGGEVKEIYTKSYVLEYYSYSEINAIWDDRNYIILQVIPDRYTYTLFSKTEPWKSYYEAKCKLYGDFGYDRKLSYSAAVFHDESGTEIYHRFQDRDFTDIHISSDAGYDNSHPAGSSLNDIFYFASSPIKYIERGYKDPYQWDAAKLPAYYINYINSVHSIEEDGIEPVYGLVSNLEETDMQLWGNGVTESICPTFAVLVPSKEPETEKTHNITITLTDTDGNELTATVLVEFGES